MNVTLISFATARFVVNQERLEASARKMGITAIRSYRESDLMNTEFYRKHQQIFSQERGFGYWLWKPYFIEQALSTVKEGDVVIYVDAGAALIRPLDPLLEIAETNPIVLFYTPGRINRYWTKRDCFIRMGCDEPKYYDGPNLTAAFQLYRKCDRSTQFVREYLSYCSDPQILADAPSTQGEELDDFIGHRHDQSVLSLLAQRENLPIFRDPSQWGNHGKPAELREPDEPLEAPYLLHPMTNSPYPTLFDHHRYRPRWFIRRALGRIRRKFFIPAQNNLQQEFEFPASALAPMVARNRESLKLVPDWIDPAAMEESQFAYGLPAPVRKYINLPLGSSITYTDAISFLSQKVLPSIEYLEIGVSVGKNIFQVLNSFSKARVTAFDIEEINPPLEAQMKLLSEEKWPGDANTAKRGAISSLKTYTHPASGNEFRYLSGDAFVESCRRKLAGRRFNVIFSDALHWPESIVKEWEMVEKYDLLDPTGFVLVWDDLNGLMVHGFETIWRRVLKRHGPDRLHKLLLPLDGWLGKNEVKHPIGFIVKIPEGVPTVQGCRFLQTQTA